jgi:hypothetical protein
MFLILFAVSVVFVSSGNAKKTTVYLSSSNLSTYEHEEQERGNYYTLQFQIPNEIKGKELYGAILEFYVDVSGVSRDEESVKVPILELYALKSAFGGSLSSAQLDTDTHRILNVPPGEDRKIRIDITEVVRAYMKDPSKNCGLIIGGLADYREGSLSWKTSAYDGGYLARIDYHYNARSGQ